MAKDFKSVLAFNLTEALATSLATAILAHHNFELSIVIAGVKGFMSFASEAFQQRAAKKLMEDIALKSCEQIALVFDNEQIVIDDEGRTAVAHLLVDTINEQTVTAEVLVTHKLDADRLTDALYKTAVVSLKSFTEGEVQLFERALQESCRSIVRIAAELPTFSQATFASLLQSQDTIINSVIEILATIKRDRQQDENREMTATERFQSQYKEALYQLDRVDLLGIRASPQSRRYNLSVAYVSLTVEPHQDKGRFKLKDNDLRALALQKLSTSQRKDAVANLVVGFDAQNEQPRKLVRSRMTIEDLISTSDRVFIRGVAGSGKTTLLQWIAVQAAKGNFSERLSKLNGRIPFFIRLRHRVELQHPRPRLVLPESDQFLGELKPYVTVPMPIGWVDQQLESGNAIILIDGVDEIDVADQEPLRSWIATLSHRFSNCRFVVTGRTHLKADWLNSAGFRSAEIQSMLRADVQSFIDHWHSAVSMEVVDEHERQQLPQLAEQLKTILRRSSELRRLATSPLLCSMLCALNRDGRQLPTDRIKLYTECVDVLLEKRELQAEIKISGLPLLSLKQKSALLQHIAYQLLLLGVPETSNVNVLKWIAEKLESLVGLPANLDAESVLEFLLQRSGVIREPSVGYVDFIHKTFQDFLAAHALLDHADWGLVIRNAVDDQWTDVIVLAVGIAPKPIRDLMMGMFVREAESRKTREIREVFSLLAAACLPLAVEVEELLRNKILRLLKTAVPPESRTAAKMLARIGQPAVSLLNEVEIHDESAAVMCIFTLANIGSAEALSGLERFANVSNIRIRSELLRAWDYFDREEYADKILSILLKKHGHIPLPFVISLDGLGAAKGVTRLHLTRPDIPMKSIDPSGISEISELKFLTIDCSQKAFDLSVLSSLKNLQEIKIVKVGQFLNFGALAQLQQLSTLHLGRCKGLTSLEWLSGLSDMTFLSLDGSRECTSITPLQSLKNLKHLEIRNFKELRDLSPLALLHNLESIDLMGCRVVTDISPLVKLPKLREVNVKACSHYLNIAPLSKLKSVQLEADEPSYYISSR